MAITQTGATQQFTGMGTGNTGTVSTTITVPADAEIVVVQWSGYSSTANFFSGGSMTFTKGGADTAMVNVPGGDANTSFWCGAMFYLVLPDTGSNKTLKWDWAGAGAASDASTQCAVSFWKGIDTASPVRGSAGTQAGGLAFTTGTITAASGDLIIAACAFFCNSAEGSIDSWSNVALQTQLTRGGDADGALATGSPTGNTTIAASTGTNVNDGSLIGASFKAAASGAAPFSQEDWPNPRSPQYPTSLRTWTWDYNKNLVGKDAFPPGKRVFDLVTKPPPPAGPTWVSRYNDNLIGKDVLPPGRKGASFERPPPRDWRREWTLNLLQTTLAPTVAVPFRQNSVDLPPAPLFWRNGSALNLVLSTLVAQDRFPPGKSYTERSQPVSWRTEWAQNLLLSTLSVVQEEFPPGQAFFALPRSYEYPIDLRTWINGAIWLISADQAPFNQYSWPLPVSYPRSERTWTQNLLLSTLAAVVQMPLNQYNWPIPGQGWQPPRTWTSFYNINLIGKDQFPIRQMDWPLPTGYFYPASVRVAVPLNVNLFPPPPPPIVVQEYRNVKVAGGEFGFMGLRGGVVG